MPPILIINLYVTSVALVWAHVLFHLEDRQRERERGGNNPFLDDMVVGYYNGRSGSTIMNRKKILNSLWLREVKYELNINRKFLRFL